MKQVFTYLARVLGLAAAYYIGGRLGLLLLIPPGQATAFWPPSGIALAGLLICGPKCWPGVFIGAVGTSLSHADVWTPDALRLAATIAAGATLQAWAGAVLVRRAVGMPYVLERVRDILKLILLGGVLTCLINATLATFALLRAGFVQETAFLSHAFTWWAGDVLGVVVFAPVVLLLLVPRDGGISVTKQRKAIVALSMMVMFGLVVYLFAVAKGQYESARQLNFDKAGERLTLQFEKDLGVYLNTLMATERFIAASEYVSFAEYKTFTSRFFDIAPGLTGVSWVPKIDHADRAAFEASIRAQGFPGFEIRRRFERDDLRRSEDRPFYLPIAYVVPYDRNAPAHGLDIYGTDPVGGDIRKGPIDTARDTGSPQATGSFPIVQAEEHFGVIVYQPVYDPAQPHDSVQARRAGLRGYINGIFLLPELAQGLTQSAGKEAMHVVLYDTDTDTDSQGRLLYDSRTDDYKQGPPDSYDFSGVLSFKRPVAMAGRTWSVVFVEDTAALPQGMNWNLWAVALGGVLYCGLFGVFMLVVTARTAVVQRVVDARTAELARANAELEEFAYRTSHDLRSPVISTLGLLDVAEEGLAAEDCHMVEDSLNLARRSLKKLDSLIGDILQLTETANLEEAPKAVNIADMLDEALEKMAHMDGFSSISIKKDLKFDKKPVLKPLRMRVIVENLVSNAIKYRDTDKKDPFIEIMTAEEDGCFVLRVRDNGLGIPADRQGDVFKMFKRFHPRTAFGSGLGLYLVQKSADVLGGRVEFTDPGEGACFTVRIPLEG